MATATLPAPGTELGPCTEACEHRDCAAARRQAGAICTECFKPIGYGTRFYRVDACPDAYQHAACVEGRAAP